MATLDLINIVGNDPSGTLVSAYFSSPFDFTTVDSTLLASTSHPSNTDANGNNFDLQFSLTAAQTTAFQSGANYIYIVNQ